jgi:hypothetical protein
MNSRRPRPAQLVVFAYQTSLITRAPWAGPRPLTSSSSPTRPACQLIPALPRERREPVRGFLSGQRRGLAQRLLLEGGFQGAIR